MCSDYPTSGFLKFVVLAILMFPASGWAIYTEEDAEAYEDVKAGNQVGAESDPFESWNRQVFSFNEFVDEWFLRPVAKGYRAIMPPFADKAVSNFFNNLGEIGNFANSVFQLKPESAVTAAGRFTYNTVFGLGGLIDVGTAFELPEREEDFGQTLGYWGAGPGAYLMLPLMGPSTIRDFAGAGVDNVALPSLWTLVESPERYYALTLRIVDGRADLIPAEGFISGDSYTFVRNAYLQRRQFLINDGETRSDPFSSEESEDLMLEDF
jgi:phospholipid-binding lipoprotein MlaA